ncbi:MAG: TolB family protein [Rhodothermales bacterium]
MNRIAILVALATLTALDVQAQSEEEPAVESTLVIYDVETGETRDVLSAEALYEAPNWMPDGDHLVFNSEGHLYRVSVEGGEPELINTEGLDRLNNDHGISPDGTRLVVSNGDGHIYTLPIEGGTPEQVTEHTPSYWHGWSPDGETLAYIARRDDEQFDIYLIPTEGGEERTLAAHPAHEDGADYTPDGQWVYFNSDRAGNFDIWRVRPDGSDLEQITSDTYEDWFPHPSPDGALIAFLSYAPGTEGHPRYQDVRLRLMAPDGTDVREIVELFGGQGTINVPSWSPDGQRFAFVRYRLLDE